MSRVFVADEPRLGRTVVVKVLAPAPAAGVSAERFESEIPLAAALRQASARAVARRRREPPPRSPSALMRAQGRT
ncbi:MAG: hypothetical protein ACXW0Z_20010 [Gemmatirosa sp.]